LLFSSVVSFSSVTLCNYSPSSSDYGVAANVGKALNFDALFGDSGASISTMLTNFMGAATSSFFGLERSEPDFSPSLTILAGVAFESVITINPSANLSGDSSTCCFIGVRSFDLSY